MGFQGFRPDFMDFRDFKDLWYSNGLGTDFKEFTSRVKDFSRSKSGFMDFRLYIRDFRSDLKGIRS